MDTRNYADSLPEGYKLHWYEITGVIGRGGFGITYLARDLNLDMQVAIKEFLPQDFASRQDDSTVHPRTEQQTELYSWGLERFVTEARILAKFTHPNIVRVLSVFEQNNTAYMVMEYARGEDLSSVYKKRGPFHENDYLDIFIPICDGLSLVHREGFIHRDIKPENIYISDENIPLLLDFGSARQSIGSKTKALTSLVTYGYAPFEQYNEGTDKQGPWTDIYSLGASIYRGIAGRKPEDALSRGSRLLEEGKDPYQPVSIIAAGQFSQHFLLAIDNALMFRATDRPAHIMRWADMLLGKIPAPALQKDLYVEFDTSQFDKTVVKKPAAKSPPSTGPSRQSSGTGQGLISARGQRTSEPAAVTPEQPASQQILQRLQAFTAPLIERWQAIGSTTKYLAGGIVALSFVILLLIGNIIGNDEVEQPPQPPVAEVTLDEKLATLLSQAERALAEQKYTEPANKSAYDYYAQALALSAENKQALAGIKNVEQKLLALARREFDNQDFNSAKYHLNQLLLKMPGSVNAKSLLDQVLAREKSLAGIDALLTRAHASMDRKQFTEPETSSALYFYKQVLAIDPSNRDASNGLAEIEKQLFNIANKNYQQGNTEGAVKYLNQLAQVNPSSRDAAGLQAKINKDSSRQQNIDRLLASAALHMKNNRLSTPSSGNAYDTYQKVLGIDANNVTAKNGIADIRRYYQDRFNSHLKSADLKQAEYNLQKLQQVGAPGKQIDEMKKKLASARLGSTPEIQLISQAIGNFKEALELKDLTKINRLSEYRQGRKDFVYSLFRQYKTYKVTISGFKHISREHKAYARVELSELIDISNNPVIPGNWSKFEIVSFQNSRGQYVISW